MATRIERFIVTVPANTPQAAPVTIRLPMGDGRVDRIDMRWPPGPSGLVGLKVRHSQQVIIPFQDNVFIIADDEVMSWPMENFPEADFWDVVAFNTDVFVHQIHLTFLVTDVILAPTLVPLTPIG